MHGQFFASLWWKVRLMKGLEVVVCWVSYPLTLWLSDVFFVVCVCVLLCLHAGYKAVCCLEREICAVQTLLDSSLIHKHISVFVFLAGQHPFTLCEAWLMQPPLKCWYKIKLPCSTVIKSLGTGINTWSSLYSMAFLHVISSFPKPFLGREEKASLADLATYPSLTSFPCRRLTMTVWLVAALSLFEMQAFEDSDTDIKLKWQLSCLLTVCCCLQVAMDGCSWFQNLPASKCAFVVWSLYQSNAWTGLKSTSWQKLFSVWKKAKCLISFFHFMFMLCIAISCQLIAQSWE